VSNGNVRWIAHIGEEHREHAAEKVFDPVEALRDQRERVTRPERIVFMRITHELILRETATVVTGIEPNVRRWIRLVYIRVVMTVVTTMHAAYCRNHPLIHASMSPAARMASFGSTHTQYPQ